MLIDIKYNLGQRVMIKDIKTPGRITEIRIDAPSTYYYRVAYWIEGHLNHVELCEDEIDA